MRENQRLARTFVGASLLIVIGAGFSASLSDHGVASSEVIKTGTAGYMQIVVAPGESIWSLAEALNTGGRSDLLSVVDQIVSANALASTDLEPGTKLWVPAK
ncbi:MAG: LysM peptidoglycan-binding domain-containing protein [Actinomycetales bacterium]|nr:MAG: LysM peptidoglycan-binding domain-containing protein [Actinomycetales bacterium]